MRENENGAWNFKDEKAVQSLFFLISKEGNGG